VLEHQILLWNAVVWCVLFWWIFGPALEDRFGRGGLLTFFLIGAGIGLVMVISPTFGMTGAFWLGMSGSMFLMGACYPLFSDNDVRLVFVAWFIWAGAGFAQFRMPVLFALIPMQVSLYLSQSLFWYGDSTSRITVRWGSVTPVAWCLMLTFAGVMTGIMWKKNEMRAALAEANLLSKEKAQGTQPTNRP